MASLASYHHLPKISLAKLYESYTSSNNTSKIQQSVTSNAHNQHIKVQSPFYQKHQLHKGPCYCAYHRMKRYKEKGIINRNDPNTKMKDAINQYKFRIANAVKQASQSSKNNMGDVFNYQQKYRHFRNTQNKKIQKLDSVSENAKIKDKANLDNYNYLFEEILRKRMQPMQDYQKVQNLIKFVRLRNNYDGKYLTKTKDYIYLHLLKLTQKIPWNKLSGLAQNDPILLKLVAQIANCKQWFALELAKGIKKAMKDMEGFLVQRMKQKQISQQAGQQINKQKGSQLGKGFESPGKQSGLYYFDQYGNSIQSPMIDQNKQNILGSLDQFSNKNKNLLLEGLGNSLGNSRHHSLLNSISSSSRRRAGVISHKKSNILNDHQKLSQFNSLTSTSKAFQFAETKKQENSQTFNIKDTFPQHNLKRFSKDILSNFHEKGNFRRSKFNPNSTNNNKEVNDDDDSYLNKNYENGTSKDRKGQLHHKRRLSKQKQQPPCPFKNVNYEKLVSKQEFERIKHILNDNRNPYPEEDRMRKLFQFIQRRISGSPQFFEDFIAKFQNVLSPQQLNILKQKYEKYEFQIMIYKLTKQVDSCLLELKNTEDLLWRQQQDDNNLKGNKNLSLTKKTINIECIQSDMGLIEQFQNFTVIQNTAPPIPIQEDKQLQQIGLGEMELQQFIVLHQTTFKSIYDQCNKVKIRNKKQEELDWKNSIINEQKHRKILRYMKSKHPCVFNEVMQNIHDTLSLNNSSVL